MAILYHTDLVFCMINLFFDWKVVHNPEYNYYSPGNLLVGKIIDKIIDDGYDKFNFMTGDYRYKRSWISEDQTSFNSETFLFKKDVSG